MQSWVRKTTHEPLSRSLTTEQVALRLEHGCPCHGQKLVARFKHESGGAYYVCQHYQPGTGAYWLSVNSDSHGPTESKIGNLPRAKPPQPVVIVRKRKVA